MDENQNFNFKNIFPECIKDFNDIENDIGNNIYTNVFYKVCLHINTQLGLWGSGFNNICVYLCNYLKHIITKNPNDVRSYCIYFNYVLKSELKYLETSCIGEKACYKKMIEVYKKNGMYDMDICYSYVNNLQDNIYKILHILNALYNYHEKLKTGSITCTSDSQCFKNYTDFIRKCNDMKNKSLNKVMEIVKDKYKDYIKNNDDSSDFSEQLDTSSRISTPKLILIICIITLAIPFIAFILYNITPCRLYLETKIKMLKEQWNKKSKHNLKLLNSFESDFEELIDKCSPIAYNALRYS
ncbi:variable surface protein [Plasmodium gonderi]|uniref:Variable surface protein n=1 Tax=Plasmodium gonderi TaxID=77519 RepID=A0A1Y1JP37_PLAGO|nr:variable surface protein [Plasmodium gonderi]GAW84000.1 variable surface protein [Plasmodium gonderi]